MSYCKSYELLSPQRERVGSWEGRTRVGTWEGRTRNGTWDGKARVGTWESRETVGTRSVGTMSVKGGQGKGRQKV